MIWAFVITFKSHFSNGETTLVKIQVYVNIRLDLLLCRILVVQHKSYITELLI